jgi:hypothetical protein
MQRLASGGLRHSFQMSETPRIAEADSYGQSGLDGWHEREIVWQFEQIGNREAKAMLR